MPQAHGEIHLFILNYGFVAPIGRAPAFKQGLRVRNPSNSLSAPVAELVDAADLGSAALRGGSSPFRCTKKIFIL